MRFQTIRLLVLILIAANLALLWYFAYTNEDGDTAIDAFIRTEGNDFTVVVPEFEPYEHDLTAFVSTVFTVHRDSVPVVIVATETPYPFVKLPTGNARFVITKPSPDKPRDASDPLAYIRSSYTVIVPDGMRITQPLTSLVQSHASYAARNARKGHVTAFLVGNVSECEAVNVDLRHWTLRYTHQPSLATCSHLASPSAVLVLHTSLLRNLSESFPRPFFDAFYIQAHLRGWHVHVARTDTLQMGRSMFENEHKRWKRDSALHTARVALYHRWGVKRVVRADGREEWYGCTKTTPRCFGSVIDTPAYLYEGRYTPPCCLNALRSTARHVFQVFDRSHLSYWLEGGSLLGAARSGDIIPWDYDVDIGMFHEDLTKVAQLREVWSGKKHVDDKGFVWERAKEGEFLRVQYSAVNRMHVDIFPFYERDGIMTKNTWFKDHRQDMEFPAHFLRPLARIPFIGVQASAPNNYREFLELKFGVGVIENPQYPFPENLLRRND